MKAIGKLKAKKTVTCTVCCGKLNRSVSVNIYENTEAEKQEASKKLIEKANAPYTCRICKSILKEVC